MTVLLALADRAADKAGLLACLALLIALWPLAAWVRRRDWRAFVRRNWQGHGGTPGQHSQERGDK